MVAASSPEVSAAAVEVDLKNRHLAALLAWLWPGAGHLYQQRYAKGAIFMICILGCWFFGLFLGEGKVVYADWGRGQDRWQYLCQVGVGVPAFPALLQFYRVRGGQAPLWNGFMAPPFKARPNGNDETSDWNRDLHFWFELGTLYTIVAGLLNVLAIYDAYAGPLVAVAKEEEEPPGGEAGRRRAPGGSA